MNNASRIAAIRQQIAAALPYLRQGIGIPWTLAIAGFSLYSVFASGDLNTILPFLTGIGGGLLGDTLRDWALGDKKPSADEITALLQRALERNEATEGLLAELEDKLHLLDLLYERMQDAPADFVGLMTAEELRLQLRLFGHTLDDQFKQMHQRFDRIEVLLGVTDHQQWRRRHFNLPIEPPGAPPVFVGREDELNQLHAFLAALAAGEQLGCMLLVYGSAGIGKRELVRQWLADVSEESAPPLMARTTFLPDELTTLAHVDYYRTHPVWELDWTRYGDALRAHLPQEFMLGSYPWLALAVQLAAQSPAIQQALTSHRAALDELKLAGAEPPLRAITHLLRLAAGEGRPLIVTLEHFQRASDSWFTLLRAWVKEIAQARLPVLLVVETSFPRPLERELPENLDERLRWLRTYFSQPHHRSQALYLAPLTRFQVAGFLTSDCRDWAADLHLLTDGVPGLIELLLAHWQSLGLAERDGDGLWRIQRDAGATYPGALYDQLIDEPLEEAAVRCQEIGYDITPQDLLDWLNFAVWEGDVFTDDALARAVGWHGDALEDLQIILDDALCASDDTHNGVLQEEDEPVVLPYGDNQAHSYARYRFQPLLLAALLRQRQDFDERRRRGHAYAQALLAAYAPHHERILDSLIWLYESIGLPQFASTYHLRRSVLTNLESMEIELPILDALANDWLSRRILLSKILRYSQAAFRVRHPQRLIPWLERGLELARALPDVSDEAYTLHGLAWVYSALGEKQRALELFEQALPLFRQVGDRSGEAYTLHGLAWVYSDLGEKQRALELYEQALPLFRQVGDRRGEAYTLHGLAVVYSALGEKQRALELFEQALVLRVQIRDRWEEPDTRAAIAQIEQELGNLERAEEQLVLAVALAETLGHPDLEKYHTQLAEVRRLRGGE